MAEIRSPHPRKPGAKSAHGKLHTKLRKGNTGGIVFNNTKAGDLPLSTKARQGQAEKVKLNSAGNIRQGIPYYSSMGFITIMKSRLIAEFPNSIKNRLDQEDSDGILPPVVRRPAEKESHGHKRPKGRFN